MATKKTSGISLDKDIIKPIKKRFAKEASSLRQKLLGMLGIVTGVSKSIEQMVGVVSDRARAAGGNLFILILLSVLLTSLAIVVWLLLLGCLYLYLISIAWTALAAVAVLTGVNFILLLIVLYFVIKYKKNLTSSLGFKD